jgi:hypothetical protein
MANVQISNLPQYTGSTTDGWVIFNDSGETTTSKYQLSVDLGNLSSSPFEEFNGSVDKISNTLPTNWNSSRNTFFFGSGFTANNGWTNNSMVVGTGHDINQLPANMNSYIYLFGANNTQRIGTHSYLFGNGNASNASAYNFAFGVGNNINGNPTFAFGTSNVTERSYAVMFGNNNWAQGQYSTAFGNSHRIVGQTGGDFDQSGLYNNIFGGNTNKIFNEGNYHTIVNGNNNFVSGTTDNYNTIIGSSTCNTNGKDRVVMLGLSGHTADVDNCTYVENLKLVNYALLNFPDDATAALNGVVLGQIYHTSGVLKVRTT